MCEEVVECVNSVYLCKLNKGFCRFLFGNGRTDPHFELLLPAAAIQNSKKEGFCRYGWIGTNFQLLLPAAAIQNSKKRGVHNQKLQWNLNFIVIIQI